MDRWYTAVGFTLAIFASMSSRCLYFGLRVIPDLPRRGSHWTKWAGTGYFQERLKSFPSVRLASKMASITTRPSSVTGPLLSRLIGILL